MGSSRFWLEVADEDSKSIPREFPRYHWLKATGQCVIERYLSSTMESSEIPVNTPICDVKYIFQKEDVRHNTSFYHR